MKFTIFTDGSVDSKQGTCSSAMILTMNDPNTIIQSSVYSCEGTSQKGEVRAVFLALCNYLPVIEHLAKDEIVDVWLVSDSDYTIRSITEYSIAWRKKGFDVTWTNSRGEPVSHQETFKSILKLIAKYTTINIKFLHINSHIDMKATGKKSPEVFYEKFKKKNGIVIPYNSFLDMVIYNNYVDNLAGEVLKLKRLFNVS